MGTQLAAVARVDEAMVKTLIVKAVTLKEVPVGWFQSGENKWFQTGS